MTAKVLPRAIEKYACGLQKPGLATRKARALEMPENGRKAFLGFAVFSF